MTPVIGGGLSALGLGTADFMARFSSRAFGHAEALLGVLVVGSLILSIWGLFFGPELVRTWEAAHLLVLNAVATTAMTLLLYKGLARGPVSVVAAIVATHPVLVVMIAVLLGARPTELQWLAMAVTVAGGITVALTAVSEKSDAGSEADAPPGGLRTTIIISIMASLAYAVLVSAGQHAVPVYGEFQTLWFGRMLSLVALLVWFLLCRKVPGIPLRWWPFVIAQAILDTGGYFALFSGSAGANAEIAAVVAATFGGVTILWAWVILKEHISMGQWIGIAMILGGVMALST